MTRGRFITFEGGEGAGKSTQARLLADYLGTRGVTVVVTREPGGSAFAERVRDLVLDAATPAPSALAEALMFNAARADHLDRLVIPALERGDWVICDRFYDSTRVYQGEVGGMSAEVLAQLDEIVVRGWRPDLTIVVDLDPVVGLARVAQRRGNAPTSGAPAPVDRYEARGQRFHEALRAGFLKLAEADPIRCVVVDGFKPVDALALDIKGHVDARLVRARG